MRLFLLITFSVSINLISIPSIFYGTRIKPGSISLKWYYTGSLAAEAQDSNQNGELIQVGPRGSTGSGSVAGVVLYDEGIILLTGSWNINGESVTLDGASQKPSWIHYGAGITGSTTTPTSNDPTTPENPNDPNDLTDDN